MTHFLLASASPRRRELFGLLRLSFDVTSADVDESPLDGESPARMVMRLAHAKAQVAPARSPDHALVIASDTTVSLDGIPLGKPRDALDADRMLRALRGRAHQVHTGLAVFDARTNRVHAALATTDVPMRAYTDNEIAAYIATGDPLDKAGAYAIQHAGFHPVDDLRGCFANVMGLPLCHLARGLRALNIAPPVDVPAVCQAHIQYNCPVYAQIMRET